MGRFDYARSVCLSCLLVLASVAVNAQSTNGPGVSLTGTVYADGTNQRLANATVDLCDEQGNRMEQTNGNEAGEFSFRGIPAQNYMLRVRAEGFEAAELHIDLRLSSERGLPVMLKPIRLPGSRVPDRATISAHELAMPEPARDLVTSGKQKLYKDKNAPGALRDFQSAISKAPDYYEAHYQAGMAYLTLQNEGQAEKEFRKSVEMSGKKYGDADIALATLLLQRKEAAEGEGLLRAGLAVNPNSWPGQIELGKLELSRGHLELALAAAEKAESLAPLQPMVYRLLAVVHLQQKDYSAAVSDLDSYIRLDPDSPGGMRAKELRAQVANQLAKSQGQTVSASK